MKKIKTIFENIKFKWLRETSLTIMLIAIIIIAFLAINIGIDKLEFTDLDLTSEKLYTLTETSKEQLAKIPEEETFKIYLFGYIENSSVADLVKQYIKARDTITMEITTADDRPDLASKYEITEEGYYVVITSGDKDRTLTQYDLYTMDYTTGSTIDITEQRITNAILSISSIAKNTPVYLLRGHEEYSTEKYLSTIRTYLEVENYEFKNLDLLVEEKVPEDCETLIIATPKHDFAELEANKIKEYINAGGNILWMSDSFALNEEYNNIKSVLDLYGVTIDQAGFMIEQDTSKMVMQSPDIILPTIEMTELTAELSTEGIVMFLDSSKLSFVDSEKMEELKVQKTDLLTTSDKAFYRTDASIPAITPTQDEVVGKQVVGAILEKTVKESEEEDGENVTSKLVVYANNKFATDATLTVGSQYVPAIYFYNNIDLVMNSVAYLAKVEDQITIRKSAEVVKYTATETQNIIVMAIIFSVPVLIVIIGIVVWQLRRRKK